MRDSGRNDLSIGGVRNDGHMQDAGRTAMGGRDEAPTGRQRLTLKGSGQQRAAAEAAVPLLSDGLLRSERAIGPSSPEASAETPG